MIKREKMSAFLQALSQLLGQAAPPAQAVGGFVNSQQPQPVAAPVNPAFAPAAGQLGLSGRLALVRGMLVILV